jgi:predicted dehydrogenase
MSIPPVRYAVVGLGHISQAAVLPAFSHATDNSRLVALVSGEPVKRKRLSKRYRVPACPYEAYGSLLRSGTVDAVYIALPNDLHKRYVVQAAEAGVHILCEKPLAVTYREGIEMIQSAQKNRVYLMTAYRLHFERMNLTAIRYAKSGQLGELRFFTSTFSRNVKEGDIRLQSARGGGSIYDLGVYCINAARYLFGDEPVGVFAAASFRKDRTGRSVEETTSVVLRFSKDRFATFISSVDAASTGSFTLVGTKGSLFANPAYDYADDLRLSITVDETTHEHVYKQRDQFAAELIYFSDCIRRHRAPEPSGQEGLCDLRVIEAVYKSAKGHRWIALPRLRLSKMRRPTLHQNIQRPKVQKPDLVMASSSTGEK